MAAVKVMNPLSVGVANRRESSTADHVNRIRTANSKRQFAPWSKNANEQRFPDTSKKANAQKAVSMSEMTKNRKFHKNCISEESIRDLHEAESKSKNKKDHHPISRQQKIPLDSDKQSKSPRPSQLHEETSAAKRNKIIPRKIHTRENAEKSEKKLNKKNVEKSEKITEVKPNSKVPVSKKKKNLKSANRKLSRKDDTDEHSLQQKSASGYDSDFEYIPYDTDKFLNLKDSLSSKDIIVLKWIHNLDECPQSDKSNFKENKLQRSPIRILQKTPESQIAQIPKTVANEKEFKDTRNKSKTKSSKNKSGKFTKTRSVSEADMTNKYEERKNQNAKPKTNVENKRKELLTDRRGEDDVDLAQQKGNGFELNAKTSASNDNSRYLQDVEMSVSELGKLHILLNLKSLTPEDAAVIIWLDDLPKSFLEPNYRRRLSITSFKDAQSIGSSAASLKSFSTSQLEDIASPRPYIHFPSVTILKNIVVDSKVGLKTLSEDLSSSVYYKRCNLSHVNSENFK